MIKDLKEYPVDWGQFPTDIAQDIISFIINRYDKHLEYAEWDAFTYPEGKIFMQFKMIQGLGKAYNIKITETLREEDNEKQI